MKGSIVMYSIVFTKGNDETIIAQYGSLDQAKEEAKKLENTPEYCNGIITVEFRTEKGARIL